MPLCAFALPITGTLYLLSRPSNIKIVAVPFCLSIVVCIVALILLFTFTVDLQVDYLVSCGWNEYAADVVVPILIVFEVGIVTGILFEILWGNKEYNAFLKELEIRGTTERLKKDFGVEKLDEVGTCANIWHTILFTLIRLALMAVTLPVTVAPLAGQVLWLYINGWLLPWQLISPFLGNLKITGFRAQIYHVLNHWWSYSTFGAVSLFLTLLPFVNILFKLGSAYGLAIMFDNFAMELEGGSSCLCIPNYSRSVYWKDGKKMDRRTNEVVAREPPREHGYLRLDDDGVL